MSLRFPIALALSIVCLAAPSVVGAEVQTLMETQILELSSAVGAIKVTFVPEQSAGIIDACALLYRVIGQDNVYQRGNLFVLEGNISYGNNPDRSLSYLKIKIGMYDTLDFSGRPEPPFFAYIQTAHGTTARSRFNQFDSPDWPGYRHFIFAFDENAVKVISDLMFGAPVTIGFNRMKGGPDVLVPLDLNVVNTRVSEAGVTRYRSKKTLHEFSACAEDVTKQAMNLAK